MLAHEVSLDQPFLGNYGDPEDPEDPENPENEELSIKIPLRHCDGCSFGKCESMDIAVENDKSPLESIQQLLLENQKQMDDCDEEIWDDRNTFRTLGESKFERLAQIQPD